MKSLADARRRMEGLAYGMSIHPSWVSGRSRNRFLLRARRSIARQMRRDGYSLRMIGMAMGGRDHSTILSLLRHGEKT